MATVSRPLSDPRVPPAGTRMTLEEFFSLPDDARVELVDGVLQYKDEAPDVSPAQRAHGSVAARILVALGAYAAPRGLGEVYDSSTGFLLRCDPPLQRSPDVSFVDASREPGGAPLEDEHEALSPDLAVEVLSPSNTASAMGVKVREYLQCGVRVVWVVDPFERSVAVYDPAGSVRWLREGDDVEGGDVVPGFRMPVAAMFAGLRPRP